MYPNTFHVYQDKKQLWRWRAVARNGNIVADSGQGYTTRRHAERAVKAFLSKPMIFNRDA